ncbi:hypothetical protein LTR53_007381 [Teratosphaeriaceae sp. CCFEE 6253]|nr:hypothetical protein LTR53_007381 [Teratosphaeriaceae sp. CCFEE 6253]
MSSPPPSKKRKPRNVTPDSPLHQLAGDLMAMLTQRMAIADLKNLRVASRWAEDQAFTNFATQAYGHLSLSVEPTHRQVERLASVVTRSPRLASFVKALTVTWAKVGEALALGELQCWRQDTIVFRRWQALGPESMVSSLLVALPELRSLELVDLTRRSFAWHLHGLCLAADAKLRTGELTNETLLGGPPALRTITLHRARLSTAELQLLMPAFSHTLIDVCFREVTSVGGDWHLIFQTMQRSLAQLKRLALSTLSSSQVHQHSVEFLPEGRHAFHKAIRGLTGGIEVVTMRATTADAHGVLAVQFTLAKLVEHIAPAGWQRLSKVATLA